MKALVLISLLICFSCIQQPAQVKSAETTESGSCDISAQAKALSDPQSIDEFVAFINALPMPVQLDCFVASLKRPLNINATSSTSSAQPAAGSGSPRIFIFKGDLVISIVPSGMGAAVIELSELTSTTTSIKAEIPMPVTRALSASDPYNTILRVNRTTCIGCHETETQVSSVNGVAVFESEAFKPDANRKISINNLNQELYSCQLYKDKTQRCLVIEALMMNGIVQWQDFPGSMPTMFGTF